MPMSQRTALVTGTVSGIGRATTARLVAEGWHVFATVMDKAEAEDVKSAFGDAVTTLIVDVTDGVSVTAAAKAVETALGDRRLDGLVNNAGIAVAGPAMELPIEDFQHQLEVNVTGVLRVTQAFGPLLGTDPDREGGPGRIVMLSSVAGQLGSPFLAPYVASKHAIEGLSKSLRIELQHYGIDVIMIGPGIVATPIWEKAQAIDDAPYRQSPLYQAMRNVRDYFAEAGPAGLPPETIADRICRALSDKSPRLRYALVPGRLANWSIPKLLPDRLLDRIVARRAGIVED